MTAQLQSPWIYLADSDGQPLVGAKVRIYEPGTTTPLDVYSDEEATVPVSQPIISDAAGRVVRYYVDQKYRMTVHTSADVLVQDLDDQDPGLPSGFGVSATVGVAQGGTGATNAAAARTNLGAASAASLTSVQDTVTEHATFIDTARNVGDTTRAGLLAKEDEVTPSLMAEQLVCTQRVIKTTVSNSTTTSSIPYDTSVPQISEGTLLFTQSFAPLSTTSEVRIHCHFAFESSGNNYVVAALFKNSDANALMAEGAVTQINSPDHIDLHYRVSPGSTSSVTWTVRMGIGGSGTLRANGSGGTGTFGGSFVQSFLLIEEWETKS